MIRWGLRPSQPASLIPGSQVALTFYRRAREAGGESPAGIGRSPARAAWRVSGASRKLRALVLRLGWRGASA